MTQTRPHKNGGVVQTALSVIFAPFWKQVTNAISTHLLSQLPYQNLKEFFFIRLPVSPLLSKKFHTTGEIPMNANPYANKRSMEKT